MKRVDALIGLAILCSIIWWNQNRGFCQLVTHVHDGDTITVRDQKDGVWGDPYSVRLLAADASELWQTGKDGEQAEMSRKRLMRHLVGKTVSLEQCDESYNRKVCKVYLKGQDVSAWLISKGLAKQDQRFSKGKYDRQEKFAKFFRLGVWSYDAVDPWDARAERKRDK